MSLVDPWFGSRSLSSFRALCLIVLALLASAPRAAAECGEDGFWRPTEAELASREGIFTQLLSLLPAPSSGWTLESEASLPPFQVRCQPGVPPEIRVTVARTYLREFDADAVRVAQDATRATPEEEEMALRRRSRQRQLAVDRERAGELADFALQGRLDQELAELTRQGAEWNQRLRSRQQAAVQPLLQDSRARLVVTANARDWHLPRGPERTLPGVERAFEAHRPEDPEFLVDDLVEGLELFLGPWQEVTRDRRRVLEISSRAGAEAAVTSLVVEALGRPGRVATLLAALRPVDLLEQLSSRSFPAGAQSSASPEPRGLTLADFVDRPGDLDLVMEGSSPGPSALSLQLSAPDHRAVLDRLGTDLPGVRPEGIAQRPSRTLPASAGRTLERVVAELEMLREELGEECSEVASGRLGRRLGHQIEVLRELLEDR